LAPPLGFACPPAAAVWELLHLKRLGLLLELEERQMRDDYSKMDVFSTPIQRKNKPGIGLQPWAKPQSGTPLAQQKRNLVKTQKTDARRLLQDGRLLDAHPAQEQARYCCLGLG